MLIKGTVNLTGQIIIQSGSRSFEDITQLKLVILPAV